MASIVGNISSLRALLFGGVVLDFQEILHYEIFRVHDARKYVQKYILQNNSISTDDNKMVETFCVEMWRFWFGNRIKFCYDVENYFPTFSHKMLAKNFVNSMLNLNPTLAMAKQLEQKWSQLDAKSIVKLLSGIIKSLKVLDLEYSNIKEEAAITLSEALNCNNVLEQLWLRGNILGADGAAVILTSLQNISTLKILDLSYNNISSTSANGIAAVINSNHFLEQLWLDGNMLMNTGVVIIASVLKRHSNLTLLSLSNNGITEDAAEEISDIVNNNSRLTS